MSFSAIEELLTYFDKMPDPHLYSVRVYKGPGVFNEVQFWGHMCQRHLIFKTKSRHGLDVAAKRALKKLKNYVKENREASRRFQESLARLA